MAVIITANNAEFNKAMKQSSQAMNGLESTIAATRKAMMTAFGGFTLYRGLEFGIRTLADFEYQMSTVRAITGAVGPEFQSLRNDALELAGAFKAIDIAKMQTDLGRLGFSTQEIRNSTKAVIDLAAATGSDLAQSADVAGSTLRAFNLQATEMQRVTDVMAGGFNRTALGIENFSEAIKYVAPVAEQAGLSIEQTTAMLGVLADAGIRGSNAGTALRKIISDLGEGAAPVLNKRLAEMAKAGLSGAEAMDEVGRTAYASLLVLSNNIPKLEELNAQLHNVTGESEAMSNVMQDNLIGDWNKFTAAIDAWINSASSVPSILRAIVQTGTNFFGGQNKDFFGPTLQAIPGLSQFFPDKKSGHGAASTWDDAIKSVSQKAPVIAEPSMRQQSLQGSKGFKAPATVFEMNEYEAALIRGLAAQDKFAAGNLTLSKTFEQSTAATVAYLEKIGDDKKWESIRANMETTAVAAEQANMRIVNAMMQVGDAIGDALVSSIQSGESFVENLAKQTDQTLAQLYRLAVGWMIEKSIQSGGPFPLANIAIATAGVIALRGLFATVNSGGSSASVSAARPRGADMAGGGQYEFVIKGDTLRAFNRRSAYNASKLGG